MSASYGQPPPPNVGYNYPDGRNQGQFPGYQAQHSQGQPPYGSQGFGNQGYSGPPGPYPAQSGPFQDGSAQAQPGVPPNSYGPPPTGAQPYPANNLGYNFNRPHKRSQDWGSDYSPRYEQQNNHNSQHDRSSEYPRKRFSGQYTNPPYQQGPPQVMRPQQPNFAPNQYPGSSSPPYQGSSPNYSYQAAPQYPPPPAPVHGGPPASYSNPGYGYQPTSGPPPNLQANGYAQGGYPGQHPEYNQGPQHQRYPAPPPPTTCPDHTQAGYPNQNAYVSPQGQTSYTPRGSYSGQNPYPYQNTAAQPEDYSPMTRPQRQDSGPYPQYSREGQLQVDPYQYISPEGEQQSSSHGTGYDYTVPTERASDVDFVFPRGPKGESMGKSKEYFAVMQELDAERFSWDGALHPLPNEPIDPNFSVGKAGIITQHYAEPIRFPLESSMEADNEARIRRPLLSTPFDHITSKYFDDTLALRQDFPKSKDPLFSMPNQRLNEFISIQNARLFLDTPDDEPPDDEEDVMSGLENALNRGSTPPTEALPETQPDSETPQNTMPMLDPETERMLAELGVSVDGIDPVAKAEPTPPTVTPDRPVLGSQSLPPPKHEFECQPEPPPVEHRPESRREFNREGYPPQYQQEWRQEYPSTRHHDYPERRPDYRGDYRLEPYTENRPNYPGCSRSPHSITPPRGSPYPNGRRDSNVTAAGSDFGPPRSPTPPQPPPPEQHNPLKRKSTDDLEGSSTLRRRKSKVKGADTGSIYGRRD